ncbi:MAG: ABC transporter substrate-binding protein [Dehalococcoidia bacterium]|nr:ABC transporter substrate-binding protein [Dehalococcoidia bacterium]MSQ35308.1 ABC transporter substrate-binding protein [Dehalococcoidia bacterium]
MRNLNQSWKTLALVSAAIAATLAAACGGDAPTATPLPPAPTAKPAPAAAPTSTSVPPVVAPTSASTPTAAAALPTATALPTAVPVKNLPQPKNPKGMITIVVQTVAAEPGIGHAGGGEASVYWGSGETLFTTKEGPVFGEPWLARSWTLAPDMSKVTITLQKGVQFHKGYGEMTAADVAWSINDASARTTPTSIHPQAGDLSPTFKAWTVVDDHTVDAPFVIYSPAWQTNALSDGWQPTGIFSKKAFDTQGEDWMKKNIVQTGAYEVTEWTEAKQAVLKAVKNHWRQSPKIDQLTYLAIPEASIRLAMIKTGEADVAELALKDVPALLKDGYALTGTTNGSEMNLPFGGNLWETRNANTGDPLLRPGLDSSKPWIGDPVSGTSLERATMVRKALSMALDRETLNDMLAAGLGWPSYIAMFNPRMPQYQTKWNMPYDPAGAKKLLAEAGYPAGFKISIFGENSNQIRADMAKAVSGYWQKLGLDVTVESYAYATWRPHLVNRTASIPFINSCDDGRFPRPWDWAAGRTLTSLSRGGFSCGVESPFIAESWLKASSEPDIQKRLAINNSVGQYLYDTQLVPSIITIPVVVVYNPAAIKEWKMHPSLSGPLNTAENIVPAR